MSDIDRFANGAKNYVENAPIQGRPFVSAICGMPGSGKSSLAKGLADLVGADVFSTNVAQWRSADDLSLTCEKVRNAQIHGRGARVPLVFIDEVDSKIANQHIYGLLLAPLGDGSYSLQGLVRELGPTMFLLAGSSPCWHSWNELRKNSYETKPKDQTPDSELDKLPDLISRFTTKPIDLTSLQPGTDAENHDPIRVRSDAVFIAISKIRERFPQARKVDRNVLCLLIECRYRHGVRSLVTGTSALPLKAVDDRIGLDGNPDFNGDLGIHLGAPSKVNSWKDVKGVVSIED
jgi:hypothetical protein